MKLLFIDDEQTFLKYLAKRMMLEGFEVKTTFSGPAILVLAPLLGALFAGLAVWIQKQLAYYIALAAMAVSCFAAVSVLTDVITSGTLQYRMAGWAPPMGIELRIDLLNAMVLVLISAIAFVNLVASVKNVEQEISDRAPSFYVRKE